MTSSLRGSMLRSEAKHSGRLSQELVLRGAKRELRTAEFGGFHAVRLAADSPNERPRE